MGSQWSCWRRVCELQHWGTCNDTGKEVLCFQEFGDVFLSGFNIPTHLTTLPYELSNHTSDWGRMISPWTGDRGRDGRNVFPSPHAAVFRWESSERSTVKQHILSVTKVSCYSLIHSIITPEGSNVKTNKNQQQTTTTVSNTAMERSNENDNHFLPASLPVLTGKPKM